MRTRCWIYKSARRQEMYLYVDREDDFSHVPAALLQALGELEPVMTLDLDPQRTLAREDVTQVIRNLTGQGYHLQMPPQLTVEALLNARAGRLDP